MSEPIPVASGPDPNPARYPVTLDGVTRLLTVAELLAATVLALPTERPARTPPGRLSSSIAAVLAVAAACQRDLLDRLADPIAPSPRHVTLEEVLAARQQVLEEC